MSRPLKWPHVYHRKNPGGTTTHVVDVGLVVLGDGRTKRERYYCKTKKAAEDKAVELRAKREQLGTLTAQKQAQASAQLAECIAILTASGIGSLKEAVELGARAKAGLVPTGSLPTAPTDSASPAATPAVGNESLPAGTKTTEEIIDEYVTARIEAKKGQAETDHEKVMKWVLKKALRPYLSKPIKVIDVAAVEKALNEGTSIRSTRNRWVSTLNQLFKYASHPARGYMSQNPAGAVVQPLSYGPTGVDGDPEKGPVHILSAAEMKLLLRLAESDERFHCMIMPLSTQAFLCLRRCEAKRFPSFQFNTEIRQYDVVAKRTRSRKNRDVETNPTFDAWRKRYWTSGTKLYPDKYADLLRQMVSELGLEWTRNTIRHTAASNYLVAYGEEATVKQLGHRDSDMLYKHYRRKVSTYENGLFWAILPLEKIDGKGTLVDVPLADPAADKTQIGGQRYGSMRM